MSWLLSPDRLYSPLLVLSPPNLWLGNDIVDGLSIGIETIPNLPDKITTIVATDPTNVIIATPEAITSTVIPWEADVFSDIADSAVKSSIDDRNICGTFADQTIKRSPETDKSCVVGSIFTVTLLASQNELYVYVPCLTSTIAISDPTTNFVPDKQS